MNSKDRSRNAKSQERNGVRRFGFQNAQKRTKVGDPP